MEDFIRKKRQEIFINVANNMLHKKYIATSSNM